MPLKARYQANSVPTLPSMTATLTQAESPKTGERCQIAGENLTTDQKYRHTQKRGWRYSRANKAVNPIEAQACHRDFGRS
jgi:ATP-dependent DNA ligase